MHSAIIKKFRNTEIEELKQIQKTFCGITKKKTVRITQNTSRNGYKEGRTKSVHIEHKITPLKSSCVKRSKH